jgi:CDP-diacylglycerol--glycerol-3-phosphate 3-phosphatidyltransferase
MGKSDRAFVFGFLGLLLGIGLNPAWWANIALVIVSLLTTLTIYNRVTRGLQELAAGNDTQPN